jgi:hypothetical protein
VLADLFSVPFAPNLPLERRPFPALDALNVRTLAGIKPASLTVMNRTTAKVRRKARRGSTAYSRRRVRARQ